MCVCFEPSASSSSCKERRFGGEVRSQKACWLVCLSEAFNVTLQLFGLEKGEIAGDELGDQGCFDQPSINAIAAFGHAFGLREGT